MSNSNKFYLTHPEDHELLSYADGELEGLAVRRVRKHLKDCWRCRTELEDLQATVTGFMRYRERAAQSLPATPKPWKNLDGDFARIDRETQLPPIAARFLAQLNNSGALSASRVAMALIAVAVLGFAYVLIDRQMPAPAQVVSPPASKPEVKTVETQPLVPVPLPTVQQKIEPVLTAAAAKPIRPVSQEVKVALALHRAGADLGEPVEVSREGNQVVVTGTALPPSRREELLTELAGIGGVSIRWEDARMGRNPSRPNANFDAGLLPWQAQLETVLGGKAALERTSNELLDLSDSIASRALALKKLDEQFSGASLSGEERRQLDGIASDHRLELARRVEELARRAAPLFAKLGVPVEVDAAALGPVPGVWPAAQRTDQLLNVLFAGADTSRTLDQTVEDVRIALARLRVAARP